MLYVDDREKPLSLQVFGASKETLGEAIKVVDKQTNVNMTDVRLTETASSLLAVFLVIYRNV